VRRRFTLAALAATCLSALLGSGSTPLRIEIVDAESGRPLAALGRAARVGDDPDIRPAPLPRGLGVFAHTHPVYFDRDGRGVRIEASRRYLLKYVDGASHWFGKRARFATEGERQEALAAAAAARRVLAGD
jgi:hypothetical protein